MAAWLDHLFRDLSFGVRSLLKTPGFTATAVLSLALGIMATTAIYSVLRAVVLDPFPYHDVDRLMSVRVSNPAQRGFRTNYTVDQFLEIAERNTIFEGTIASTITDVLWTGEGDPQRLRGNHGTFNTFDVMGVPPLIGRTPTVDDARPGAEPVAVLGYRFWQRQFGGDPRVLGRQMHLNGVVRTVIGVMPKRFMWRGADVYLPTMFERGRAVEGVRSVHLLGRLKPGVTDAQAEADLAPIIADLKQRDPIQFPDQWRVGLLPFEETFPSGIRQDIWVLFGAVSLLLLIACANVSNLLLSKVASRQREMTVRAALGAGRGRLIRQLLTESLLLALAAGVLGTALAYAGLPAILALVPPGMIPDEAEITLNRAVLAFALTLSAVTSVVCGLAPALHSTKTDLVTSLREASRGIGGSSRQALLRKALVVVEVALALMLLAGSSLLVRTYLAMQHVELGVDAEKVLVMRVPLPERAYPDAARRVAFFRELIGRVQAIPGVQAAAVSSGLHPLGAMRTAVDVAGAAANPEPVQIRQISAGYPDALRIRLASGRLFTEADIEGRLPIALVNERFVRTRIEGRSPVGLTVRVPRLRQPPMSLPDDAFQIVGVVHDAVNDGLANPVMPELYIPYTPAALADVVIIRGDREAATMARAAAAQVYAIDRNQPVMDVQSLEAALRRFEYATPRFNLTLLAVLAGCGLVLAIVGVYGVMSTAVAQQRHEIGVRMALGATSGSIARLVLARGAGLVAVGLAIGLAGAIAIARLLAQQVWNVPAFDPLAFAAVSAVLLVAGFQACLLPARRAARIDPLVALRDE
jgi:predicted permease